MSRHLTTLTWAATIFLLGVLAGVVWWQIRTYPSVVDLEGSRATVEMMTIRKALELMDSNHIACAKALLAASARSHLDVTVALASKEPMNERTRASLVAEAGQLQDYLKKHPELLSANACSENARSNPSLQSRRK